MEESPATLLHRLTFEMDRAADKRLRSYVGLSYRRALFLLVLQRCGTITQHQLAVALGYSDPAISAMLLELAKEGYISTSPSPEHGRKRLVAITSKGTEIVTKGRKLLDSDFDELMRAAGVDIRQYSELTERLYQALVTKMEKETHEPD